MDRQILIELYETKFGLRDHFTQPTPLGSCSFKEAQEHTEKFLLEGHLRQYLYGRIGDTLRISFDDYINRPRYELSVINKVVSEFRRIRDKSGEKIMGELESALKEEP